MTGALRPATVTGRFYPGDVEQLQRTVNELLERACPPTGRAGLPKAIIAPHAGYRYSGPIAATAYVTLAPARGVVRRVIVAGPAHFSPVLGVATPSAAAFGLPIGPVTVDGDARDHALDVPGVVVDDGAHAHEHSVEVQLPMLVAALGDVVVLPLLVGRTGAGVLAAVLDELWGGAETAIVISTDLSHYHSARRARALDARTAESICRLEAPAPDRACGAAAVAGLLVVARRHRLDVELLDLRNSADTCGDPERVVGYGAFALYSPPTGAGSSDGEP